MKKINFNQDWVFTDEARNRKEFVTLPHDAMINTERNPDQHNYFLLAGFEGGEYCYVKNFFVDLEDKKKDFILEFEGIYCMSQIFINGKLAYKKDYGFTSFQVPLNDYLEFGKDNDITVIVNVPKENHGRWYTGGGIYRPVHLYVGDKNYINLYGVKVTTEKINPPTIRVDIDVTGNGITEIAIEDGEVTLLSKEVEVRDGKASQIFELLTAKLWSAESPSLYQAKVKLKDTLGIHDIVTESFGIRQIEKSPEQGLLINGETTFLRGGCIHNDNGVIGVINNDVTELRRAQNIKRAGFNAIRSAHHPMSRSLIKACDQVGLYVMNEAFDHWYRPKGGNPYVASFLDNFKDDTIAMVQDSYNHPSVIMYSIGNEIPEAGGVKGVRIGKAIIDTIHDYDLTRLTTFCPSVHWLREYLDGVPYLTIDEDEWIAESPDNKERDWQNYVSIFMGAAENIPEDEKNLDYPPTHIQMDENATKNLYPYLDVAGYNYFEGKYEMLHELHPERVLLGTETRGTRIVETMRFAKDHPYLIGDFVWTLQDHLGEANCANVKYPKEDGENLGGSRFANKNYPWLINYAGQLDITGKILPSIHRFEFAWDENKRGLFLASQPPIHNGEKPVLGDYRWTDTVDGWTYEGYEGQQTWADAYTDAHSVEIYVNGQRQGSALVEDYFATVPCVYQPGELLGIAYDENGRELYRTSVYTSSVETMITAHPHKTIMQVGGEDFSFIDVQITDAHGNAKLLPERDISISIEGPGSIQGFGSSNYKNPSSFDQAIHQTYLGRLQAVIRSGKDKGKIRVTFAGQGIKETAIELDVE